jgi:ABC-2 type transport system ATP-binding protein
LLGRSDLVDGAARQVFKRAAALSTVSTYLRDALCASFPNLCNRVAIVDQGKIIALDTIKNLTAMLGGGVIKVGIPQVSDEILAQLAALPAVKEATLLPQSVAPLPAKGESPEQKESQAITPTPVIKIVAEHSQQAVVNVIGFLNGQSIPLTSLEILEPNLESVFLHLTGKKLRE